MNVQWQGSGGSASDVTPTSRSAEELDRSLPVRGIGVAADLDRRLVGLLAAAAENSGYRSFWVNDMPGADGLEQLRVAAHTTTTIQLGVGVLPLDRWSPPQIAERVRVLELPVQRLVLGVGAGSAQRGLSLTAAALRDLRHAVPRQLIVGGLGPRMRRLAAAEADGLLLDWMTPGAAQEAADEVDRIATSNGRMDPAETMAYVFASLGRAGSVRLREVGEYYRSLPAYAAHFARMGALPAEASVSVQSTQALHGALRPFDEAVDQVIVRPVVANQQITGYLDLVAAAAPQGWREPTSGAQAISDYIEGLK